MVQPQEVKRWARLLEPLCNSPTRGPLLRLVHLFIVNISPL